MSRRGSVLVAVLLLASLLAVFIGVADIKDRREAKKEEEEEARKSAEESSKDDKKSE